MEWGQIRLEDWSQGSLEKRNVAGLHEKAQSVKIYSEYGSHREPMEVEALSN